MKRRSDSRKIDRTLTTRGVFQLRALTIRQRVCETPGRVRWWFGTGAWLGGFFVSYHFASRDSEFLAKRINK